MVVSGARKTSRSPITDTTRAACSTFRRPSESATMPVVIAVAARARVEMLAARDVLLMSSPRAAPTSAVAAMFDLTLVPLPTLRPG